MKKFVIGVICCIGLLIITVTGGTDFAVDDKPEITSIGIGIGIGTYK